MSSIIRLFTVITFFFILSSQGCDDKNETNSTIPMENTTTETNKGNKYSSSWADYNRLIEEGKFVDAQNVVKMIYQEAVRKKNHPEQLRTLTAEIELANRLTEEALTQQWKIYNRYEKDSPYPLKSLVRLEKLHFISGMRGGDSTDGASVEEHDIRLWNKDRENAEIDKIVQLVTTDHVDVLKKTKLTDYEIAFERKEVHLNAVFPTLYHYTSIKLLEYFQENGYSRRSNLTEEEANAMLLNAADFIKVDMETRTFENERAKLVLKIYQDITRFSWERGETFATEWFNLHRITQNSSVLFANKSDAYWKFVADLGKKSSVKAIALEVDRLIIQRDYQLLKQKVNVSKQEWDALIARVDAHSKAIVLYKYLPNVKGIKNEIVAQAIEVTTEARNAINRSILAKVRYRNVNQLNYEIYQLNDQDKRGSKIAGKLVQLPSTGNYNSENVEFFIESLPQGNYELVIPAEGNAIEASTIFTVSPFTISVLGDDIYVNEFISGKPVQDKEIELLSSRWDSASSNYNRVVEAKVKTNENGAVSKKGEFIRIDGLEERVPYGYYHYRSERKSIKETFVDILTDRGIYRLGQKVFFKTIAKSYHSSNSGQILAGKSITITLKDANDQKVSSTQLTTNDFGSAEGFFQLPEGGMLGSFSLTATMDGENFTQFVRVEEYKRPKLKITWNEPDQPYQLDKDAVIVGALKTYSGMAISDAEVSYTVSENRMWYWRGINFDDESSILTYTGEAKSNAQGEFKIIIPAIKESKQRTVSYTIEVEYLDAAGEMVNSSHLVSISKDAFYIELLSKSPWNGDKATVQINSKAFNGVKVDAQGTYTLYKINKTAESPFKRLWDKPEKSLISESDFKKSYAHMDYTGKEVKPDTVKLKSGNWKTEEQFSILLNDLISGEYFLVAEARDDKGNKIEGSISVEVDKGDKILQSVLHTHFIKQPVAGEILSLAVHSSLKQADVLVQYYEEGKLLFSNTVRLQDGKGELNYRLPENTSGIIDVRSSIVQQGRLFNHALRVPVKKSFPELNVEWISFRDCIEPNSKEQWKLKVTDKEGRVLNAEVLLAMYDQSLDRFAENNYQWQELYSNYTVANRSMRENRVSANWRNSSREEELNQELMSLSPKMLYAYDGRSHFNSRYENAVMMKSSRTKAPLGAIADDKLESLEMAVPSESSMYMEEDEENEEVSFSGTPSPVRENLNELAFFLPNLRTDSKGEVNIKFNGPEALTTWRVLGMAHTKDLGYLQFERTTMTQKDMMVEVTLPRFAREGDEVYLTARVSNTTQNAMSPVVQLELFDLNTQQVINSVFNVVNPSQSIQVDVMGTTVVEWKINVPFDKNAVGVRVVAKAGNFTDGEQISLPILSNKTRITSAFPIMLNKVGDQIIDYTSILPKGEVSQLKVTLDYVQNPLWQVLMAMPDVNVKEETQTVQLANKLVALAAVDQILKNNPGIRNVLNEWKKVGADAMASELEKNPELKAIVLAETPWVVKAQSQEQRKRYLAELLTAVDAQVEGKAIWQKLAQGISFEDSRKGWPWCFGMNANVGISRAILTNLDRMKQINGSFYESIVDSKLVDEVMQYVVANKWKYYLSLKEDQKPKIDDVQLVWLMERNKGDFSKYKVMIAALDKNALSEWNKRGLNEQITVAKIAEAMGKSSTRTEIVSSLKQRAIATADRGTFWPAYQTAQGTNVGNVATQAAVIELFANQSDTKELVKQAQVWLLLNKRSNDWGDNYSTTEAIYGLLKATDWSTTAITDVIKQNGSTISIPKLEAGSGYLNVYLNNAMRQVSIKKGNINPSFGTIYAQYLIDVDKVETVQTGLKISKTLYTVSKDAKGKDVKTKVVEGASIKQGQKVYVELKLEVDQAMEYLQIKDYRAAGLDPVEQNTSYVYENGLSAYKQVKDASVTYSIDRVERGVYLIGYELYTARKGNFSNGYVMIQSAFNPEMVAYGKGSRLVIKD